MATFDIGIGKYELSTDKPKDTIVSYKDLIAYGKGIKAQIDNPEVGPDKVSQDLLDKDFSSLNTTQDFQREINILQLKDPQGKMIDINKITANNLSIYETSANSNILNNYLNYLTDTTNQTNANLLKTSISAEHNEQLTAFAGEAANRTQELYDSKAEYKTGYKQTRENLKKIYDKIIKAGISSPRINELKTQLDQDINTRRAHNISAIIQASIVELYRAGLYENSTINQSIISKYQGTNLDDNKEQFHDNIMFQAFSPDYKGQYSTDGIIGGQTINSWRGHLNLVDKGLDKKIKEKADESKESKETISGIGKHKLIEGSLDNQKFLKEFPINNQEVDSTYSIIKTTKNKQVKFSDFSVKYDFDGFNTNISNKDASINSSISDKKLIVTKVFPSGDVSYVFEGSKADQSKAEANEILDNPFVLTQVIDNREKPNLDDQKVLIKLEGAKEYTELYIITPDQDTSSLDISKQRLMDNSDDQSLLANIKALDKNNPEKRALPFSAFETQDGKIKTLKLKTKEKGGYNKDHGLLVADMLGSTKGEKLKDIINQYANIANLKNLEIKEGKVSSLSSVFISPDQLKEFKDLESLDIEQLKNASESLNISNILPQLKTLRNHGRVDIYDVDGKVINKDKSETIDLSTYPEYNIYLKDNKIYLLDKSYNAKTVSGQGVALPRGS